MKLKNGDIVYCIVDFSTRNYIKKHEFICEIDGESSLYLSQKRNIYRIKNKIDLNNNYYIFRIIYDIDVVKKIRDYNELVAFLL